MLTGRIKSLDDLPANDYHRFFPRFQPQNFDKNLELVNELEKLAGVKGCTTAQLALCWIKSKSKSASMPTIVPVFGASSEARISENVKEVILTDGDLTDINHVLATFEVAGDRYTAAAMSLTDG